MCACIKLTCMLFMVGRTGASGGNPHRHGEGIGPQHRNDCCEWGWNQRPWCEAVMSVKVRQLASGVCYLTEGGVFAKTMLCLSLGKNLHVDECVLRKKYR